MVKRKKASQSTRLTVGGRVYELVPFLKEGKRYISVDTIVERAQAVSANLGKEDGAFILERQAEIPQEFRGKFYLFFPNWSDPSRPRNVAVLYWIDGRWCQSWFWPGDVWGGGDRLVRRVK